MRSSLVSGALWMVGLTLLLFFLPLINGVIGGLVGGYKVGSVRRALQAALLPAVVVTLGMWVLLSILGLPLVGVIAGSALGLLVLFTDVGIFIGAAVGGAIAARNRASAGERA